MTAPFPHGFSDWGRYSAQATKVYLDTTFNNIAVAPANNTILTTFVGDVPRVIPFMRAITGNFEVFVQFYSDDPFAGGTITGQMNFILNAGMTWGHSVAVSGPWLAILVGSSVAVNEIETRVAAASQHGLTHFAQQGTDNLIIRSEQTVNGGQQFGSFADQVWPGMAHLSVSIDPFAPIEFDLRTRTLAGNSDKLVFKAVNPCEQWFSVLLMLPAAPVLTRITNNGLDPVDFTVSLAGQLAQPGI